jgi:surface polysaccharide O-acyltransferase-like enzyme
MMNTREHYIDNLRFVVILLVFVFHVFRIYCRRDIFYIHGGELLIPSLFIDVLGFVLMPLLFAVAGISSRYALRKRSTVEYIKERVSKLLVPLIFGLIIVVPVQPYLARLFHYGEAGYFDSFSRITDLSGYDGAFAVAHLWFLLFLFVISLICLPVMVLYNNKGKGTLGDNFLLIILILMGALPAIGSMLRIGGESPTEHMAYFLLGYFLLFNDNLLNRLEKYRHLLLGLFIVCAALIAFVTGGEFYEVPRWISILATLGYSKRYLNFSKKATNYLSNSSFGIYIFHQSWIAIVAFFIFRFTGNHVLQIILILFVSVILTFSTYEICRRNPVTRWMFGLKK